LLQKRKEKRNEGTHRWLSLPQQPVQTAPRQRPWIVCRQTRSPQARLDPWSRITRPNLHLLLTTVAAETTKLATYTQSDKKLLTLRTMIC
jgi:hypothetical protein